MSGKGFGRSASSSQSAANTSFGRATSTSRLSFLNPPPDLKQITDPNLVVSFKGLSKKNDITVAKALEDILSYVKAHPEQEGGIEDAIIKAWSQFYPRISINNSRRVRELSHLIQHEILVSAKSRIQTHLPQIIPTWLAGTFDNDKAASKAAKDGLDTLLNTPEKRQIVLKKSQPAILTYVQETLEETPDTLSDERTMTIEDMKAIYFRLVGNSIDMIAFLIKSLSEEDIKRYKDKYEDLFGNVEFLEFTSSEDTHLRRSIIQLIGVCVYRQSSVIKVNLKAIGHSLVSEALKSTQLGSAADLVETLKVLTTKFPEVWSMSIKSKKDPLARLRSFVEKGSQRGSFEYWNSLTTLLLIIPDDVFPPKITTMLELASAIRTGIKSREEPKGNLAMAWSSYLKIVHNMATKRLSESDFQVTLIQETVFPVIRNFILIDLEQSAWFVETSDNIKEALKYCRALKPGEAGDRIQLALKQELKSCSQNLCDKLFQPIPANGNEFKKNQDTLQTGFIRWFLILEWIVVDPELEQYLGSPFPKADAMLTITEHMIEVCTEALTGRQGKPYGAAAGVLACMRTSPLLVEDGLALVEFVRDFLASHLFGLIGTPSGEYLLATLKALKACQGQEESFTEIWATTLKNVLAIPAGDRQCALIALMLLRTDASELAQKNENLQDFIRDRTQDAVLSNDTPSWTLFHAAASSKSISDVAASEITDVIANALLSPHDDVTERGLRALISLSQKDLSLLVSSNERRISLLTRLMDLNEEESDSQDVTRQAAIKSLTKLLSDADNDPGRPSTNPLIEVIQTQLKAITDKPLSVQALANLARNIIANIDDPNDAETKAALFPTLLEWDQAFMPFYEQGPMVQLGSCEPFGGAVFLVKYGKPPLEDTDVPTDDDGHSTPLRMALFAGEIIQPIILHLPADHAAEILFFLSLAHQMVKSQHDAGQRHFMYETTCSHIPTFDTHLQELLLLIVSNSKTWRRHEDNETTPSHDTTAILDHLVKILLDRSSENSPLGYYSGKALSSLLGTIVSINGPKFECNEAWLKGSGLFTRDINRPFTTLAVLTGFRENLRSSELVKWFCNHLIAVIYGINGPLDEAQIDEAFLTLVMLNGTLAAYDEYKLPPHTARLAMAVKKILSWTDGRDFSGQKFALASESSRACTKLLPALKYSAGEHWQLALNNLCLSPWNLYSTLSRVEEGDAPVTVPSKRELFVLCATSMRLYSRLVRLKEAGDATVNVKEVFTEFEGAINESLVRLLRIPRLTNPPVQAAFDELLATQVLKIPVRYIRMEYMYPLLSSEVHAVQGTTFCVLSEALPKVIEDLTVKVMVEEKDVEFPPELLSLLLSNALQPREISNRRIDVANNTQEQRRSVLLAWKLVLQCFGLAPYKVRIPLQENLKETDELKHLLQFINHTFLGPDGKLRPLSQFQLDKESIRDYDVWDLSHSAGMLHSVQWLSAHVYFLALKSIPTLVKAWYLDYTRAGKVSLGDWTERYFTPLIVEDSVEDVRAWRGPNEVMEKDGQQLIVKLPAKKGNTITVSYEIDEQYCTINLGFPARYPLESIEVRSVNRFGVPEKTWNGVLKTIEAAVRFSGGNVIDGIEVFRQNIAQFMDGHEQCAICYSIVSEDMKVPEKKCATCKNSFHTKCIAKWFKSSNGNTCPMCRQNFTGTVVRR
ncbi:hypothetical protein EG329_013829 [Mollisiaceae sp. DMI_Dod_QoI]|nr:hypothetical protein EG329_013829 [Helotiales sp. DMI_Dod_QoI]